MLVRLAGRTVLIVALALSTCTYASAQYKEINLVSTGSPATPHRDPNLVNGWGMAYLPGSPFWIGDTGTGHSTLYDQFGNIIPLVVTIPPAPSQPFGPTGSPTGLVANMTADFVVTENGVSGPSLFLFDTEDGTISGWNPNVDPTHAVIAVDNSSSHAFYTGLAFARNRTKTLIFAADAANSKIDIYDGGFHLAKSFTDSSGGLGIYNVHNLNGLLYVTLASLTPNQGGVVDVFDTNGNFIKRLIENGPGGPLQGAWGIALAPANFGPFSHALLVGNVEDGHIHAFDPSTGGLLGEVKNEKGKPIVIGGLWELVFGGGEPANGKKNELFFAAGPDAYLRGLFGKIVAP